jgi:hypothetical protein
LAANQGARRAGVEAGRAYLIERHDPARATQMLLDVYRRTIAQNRTRAK